jgi:uncharacterized membrane protein
LEVHAVFRTLLIAVEVLAGSIWIGGLVVIAVVARIVREQLEPAARVEFFRSLGRRYLWVGGGALLVALVAGGLLLAGGGWTWEKTASVAVAAGLVLVTAAGVVQARSLTVLRRQAAEEPAHGPLAARIRRRARVALFDRALIAALTVALVVVAASMR